MSNRIRYEDYKKIQDLKAQGFNKNQVFIKTKIRKPTILKYWNVDEKEYFNLSHDKASDLEQYREFLSENVRLNPNIKDKVLLSRLREDCDGAEICQATFYRYIKLLRSEIGLERKTVRNFMLVEHKNPGEEMQVDCGEKTLIDLYGNKQKVYFTAFILSYSRMRFVYFSSQQFTTQTFIKAHEYAFKYFGGRTNMLMYDHASIILSAEAAGSIIFVKEFEDYIKHSGFVVYLCKKRDPCTKGKIENTVRVIKMNFLEGKQYAGINNLNSEALKWLDIFCNTTLNRHTLKAPDELFENERRHLIPTKAYNFNQEKISVVSETNTILYKYNLYSLPTGIYEKGDKVIVKELADEVHIFDCETNELVCSHPLSKEKGEIIQSNKFSYSTDTREQIVKLLNNDERLLKFLDGVQSEKPRFMHEQCLILKRTLDNFSEQEFFEAVESCNNYHKFSATEILVYLVMRYGIERVAKIINYRTKYNYIDRAKRLQIELYGGETNGGNN